LEPRHMNFLPVTQFEAITGKGVVGVLNIEKHED
jgi:hypothetical protein